LRGSRTALSIAAVVAAALLTSGCAQRPSTIDARGAREIVAHITHVKDPKTQQCYAVVASRHPGEWSQNGFTMTWELCSEGVEAQIEH
jgi:hypothetical protein